MERDYISNILNCFEPESIQKNEVFLDLLIFTTDLSKLLENSKLFDRYHQERRVEINKNSDFLTKDFLTSNDQWFFHKQIETFIILSFSINIDVKRLVIQEMVVSGCTIFKN